MNRLAEALKGKANKVFLIEDDRLEVFNSETYEKVLIQLLTERKPFLTLIGHTAMGMDLAPALATQLKMPLATDCIGIDLDGGKGIAHPSDLWREGQCRGLFSERGTLHRHRSGGAFPVEEKTPSRRKSFPSPPL